MLSLNKFSLIKRFMLWLINVYFIVDKRCNLIIHSISHPKWCLASLEGFGTRSLINISRPNLSPRFCSSRIEF